MKRPSLTIMSGEKRFIVQVKLESFLVNW